MAATNNTVQTEESTKKREERPSGRGFAGMDDERKREIASKGGQNQSKETNPGNFANNPERASEAGRKGGSA
jgi:general stress protein YciG